MNEGKKRVWLIFHGRYPSEKAASLFAAKSCEAFAGIGHTVTLLVPRRFGRARTVASEFYGIRENFKTVFLPVVDLFTLPLLKSIAFIVSFWSFSKWSFLYLLWKADRDDVIYSNESIPLLYASLWFKRTVYEVHDFPKNSFLNRLLFRRVGKVVATNRWKSEEIARLFGIPSEKIFFEPNAVDLEHFKTMGSKKMLREKLDLPQDRKIIGYVGMLRTMGMSKGIDLMLDAMRHLSVDHFFLVVGGSPEDVSYYIKRSRELGIATDRVRFVGFVNHSEIPDYMHSCDVLVAPFPKNDHYNLYMSPMKLFEYMATGVPVVATDLETIREIVTDNQSALLVPPDNAQALATSIDHLGVDRELGERIAAGATRYIENHSWTARSKRISQFLF